MRNKRRNRRVQAAILIALLAFLHINAKMVTAIPSTIATDETKAHQDVCCSLTAGVSKAIYEDMQSSKNYKLTAGISSELQKMLVDNVTIEVQEKDYVKASIQDDTEEQEDDAMQNDDEEQEKGEHKDEHEELDEECYYSLTEEEFDLECRLAVAESGNQGLMGMVYVVNCSLNYAKYNDIPIREELGSWRYSTINEDGVIGKWSGDKFYPITDDQITEEVKEAVRMAQQKDYTLEMLKEKAGKLGLDESYYEGGARYFYNPDITCQSELNKRKDIKVSFKYKDVVFYAAWK